jgi:uncharacterized protein YjbI with pentapeptide repeats
MAVVSVAGLVASTPTANAATAYPPGTVDNADPTPVLGWSGWSFTRFATDTSTIEAEAAAMVSDGLTTVGYQYVNIDDGWYICPTSAGPSVDAYGRWIPLDSAYPGSGSLNGIQVLANYIHSLGLKFGIYETMGISKNAVSAAAPILEPGQTGLPGSLAVVPGETAASIVVSPVKSQANYNCGNQDVINYGSLTTAEGQAAQDYTDSVVDELASWGVDYIKLDGVGPSNGPDVAAWQAAIAQQSRPIVLNLTQGSFKAALAPTLAQYGNEWEEPGDIEINGPSEGSADACNPNSDPATQLFTGCTDVFPLTSYSHWDNRFAFFGGTSSTGSFEWFGGPGGFNDGDSIEVGNGSTDSGMTEAAEESQLGLWSMGSASLILGGDLSASISNGYGTISSQNSAGLVQPDQSLLMNKEVLAVDQSALDAVQVSTSGSLASSTAAGNQVFAKVLPNGEAYVALFNTSAHTTPASLSTTVSAINTAIGTFNTNVAAKNPVQKYPLPVMPTLAVDSNGYELQDIWGTNSLDTGGSLATGQYAGTISSGTISATVPPEGVALFLVTPLSGATFTPPSITSSASSTFYYGTPGSVTIQTSGYPTAALTESGTLPTGMFFADNGNGTASLWGTPASGSEGIYDFTITASNGTSPNATQSYVLTVDQATPTVTVSASPDPATNGTAPVSYSVTISGVGLTPTGSVSVSDGKGGSCTIASLNGSGAGSCSITENVAGSPYTVTASYSGDGNYTAGTATIGETVVKCGGSDQGCNLNGANLENANLAGVNFAGSNLNNANLNGADLSGANLQGANLHNANLSGANLQGANLQGANLNGANLENANLAGVNFAGSNLNNANLNGANLSGANLQGANLHNANLSGANLQGANLQGANLNGANLTAATLAGATVKGANFNKITWSNTTCPDSTNSNSDGGTCINNL